MRLPETTFKAKRLDNGEYLASDSVYREGKQCFLFERKEGSTMYTGWIEVNPETFINDDRSISDLIAEERATF